MDNYTNSLTVSSNKWKNMNFPIPPIKKIPTEFHLEFQFLLIYVYTTIHTKYMSLLYNNNKL